MLKKLLEKRKAELAALTEQIKASTSADEVRSLSTKIADVKAEIADLEAEIARLENRTQRPNLPEAGETAGLRASAEYRTAFMNYVTRGTEIPAELRVDGVTTSTEVGAFISQPVMDRVIDAIETGSYGSIFERVSRFSLPAGVKFPLSSLSATWSWVAEDTCPNPQKAGEAKNFVTFNGFLGQASIAVSLVASTMTLESFEAKIVDLIVKAFYKAMDIAIVNGTGVASPLGITQDPRVTKTATLTAEDMVSWEAFYKKVVAKIPAGKRNGYWIFNRATVDGYLRTFKDQNARPLFYETGDMSANPRLAGREVLSVEADVIKDFDTASATDVIGIYAPLEDYGVNSNFNFGVRRYFDEKCNDWVTKGLVILDGKVLDASGFVVIKKG